MNLKPAMEFRSMLMKQKQAVFSALAMCNHSAGLYTHLRDATRELDQKIQHVENFIIKHRPQKNGQ